ncbi:pentapeptide repeat-containing protein [Streptomyces sp. NPDC001027]|uniref:pentapeptide repeat-containing protein n=1 Tax=Streptomyces sp. NPDC001027 TaxID=3154771 RepID=UPI0033242994
MQRKEVYEWIHIDSQNIDDSDRDMSRFIESAFSSVNFNGGRMQHGRFDTVWMHNVRLLGTALTSTTWLDTECRSSLLAGTQLHGAELQRTVFHQCKLDSVNLRGAKLRDVTFLDCSLGDVDFGGATLEGVFFPGTALDQVDFAKGSLTRVDLREVTALGLASGAEDLRGAIINTRQLLDLAPDLAQHASLTVKDS